MFYFCVGVFFIPRVMLMSSAVWANSTASPYCFRLSITSVSLLHNLSLVRTLLLFTAMGIAWSYGLHTNMQNILKGLNDKLRLTLTFICVVLVNFERYFKSRLIFILSISWVFVGWGPWVGQWRNIFFIIFHMLFYPEHTLWKVVALFLLWQLLKTMSPAASRSWRMKVVSPVLRATSWATCQWHQQLQMLLKKYSCRGHTGCGYAAKRLRFCCMLSGVHTGFFSRAACITTVFPWRLGYMHWTKCQDTTVWNRASSGFAILIKALLKQINGFS